MTFTPKEPYQPPEEEPNPFRCYPGQTECDRPSCSGRALVAQTEKLFALIPLSFGHGSLERSAFWGSTRAIT